MTLPLEDAHESRRNGVVVLDQQDARSAHARTVASATRKPGSLTFR